MKHKYDFEEELKTALQWAKEGMLPIDKENGGKRLWCNPHHQNSARYFNRNEVNVATKEELDVFHEPRRKRDRDRKREERKLIRQVKNEKALKQEFEAKIKTANELPIIEFPKTSCVVFDLETTGLEWYDNDEILSISMIDSDENILLDSYVKPYCKKEWYQASEVHGITSEMVSEAPYLHELIPKIKGIIKSAEKLIGYNILGFDLKFLREIDLDLETKEIDDVMLIFSEIYGEWNEYHQSFTWQSLETCSKYYGYVFRAHDSLEDAKATLHCYKRMMCRND